MNEVFSWPTAEVPSDPREQLRADCLQAVEAGIADLRAAYLAGEDSFGLYHSASTAKLLCGFAHMALQNNDLGRFDTYLRMLEEFHPGASGPTAEACLAGIDHGHERSLTVLEQGLAEEKERHKAYTGFRHYISPNTLIGRITHHHAEKELPANGWIERFAANQEHAWNLHTTYLRERLKKHPDNERYQAEFDEAIASTMAQPFDLGFKAFRLASDFARMKDPIARGELLFRYAKAIHGQTGHEGVVPLAKAYLCMAQATFEDPKLATPALVQYFEKYIEVSMKTQWKANVSELATDYLEWKLHLANHRKFTPEEMLHVMDQEIILLSESLADRESLEVPPEAREEHTANTAVAVRDTELLNWAVCFAERGDFAAARLYLSHIGNQESQEMGAEGCLDFAHSPEDVEALKPDVLALDFNPALALHFSIAEAVCSRDLDRIVALGVELAEKGKEDWSGTGYYVAHSMHKKLSEVYPEAALALAKAVLPIFRQNTVLEYTYVELLSLGLIRSGDLEEAAAALQHVETVPTESLQRLADIWEIAEALKG